MISGGIDLSAGNMGLLGGIIFTMLLASGMNWVAALFATLAFGAVAGMINAFFISVLLFAPFITTLATSAIFGSIALLLSNGKNIPINATLHKDLLDLMSINLGIFPLPFFIFFILLIIYGFILTSTEFGRRIYMTGGNRIAARLAGINPKKIETILYINSGVIASLTGAIYAARMHSGSLVAITGSELDAIAAAVLGGVAFTGGVGNMPGVFIGLILISSFQNGLIVSGLDGYNQLLAKGLLLIAALILDYYRDNLRIKP